MMIVAGATAAAIAAPMLRGSEGEGLSVGDVSSNTVETTVAAAAGMESAERGASEGWSSTVMLWIDALKSNVDETVFASEADAPEDKDVTLTLDVLVERVRRVRPSPCLQSRTRRILARKF